MKGVNMPKMQNMQNMPNMLQKFREAKEAEIGALIKEGESVYRAASAQAARKPPFAGSLIRKAKERGYAVIAEYKRSSPSRGEINLSLSPSDAASAYARAGAAAISVLTESRYFGGQIGFLAGMDAPGVPLLRKDFIYHPLQAAATAATRASALLVIVRALDDVSFESILSECGKYGLEPVVEVFSRSDLARAQGMGVKIVQVNNRDLDTLQTDFGVSRDLISEKRRGEVWISASGYSSRSQLEEMSSLGYDSFLVGTSLMDSSDPGGGLAELV